MNHIGSRKFFSPLTETDSETRIILLFVLLKFLLHFYTNTFAGYGIFRDELYYLSCAARPAFGYVDQPPLSLWLLTVYTSLFGNSVFAIRLLPAVFGSLTLWFSAKITKALGGGKTALTISLTAVLLAPIFLALNTYYSMNSIDIFFWTVTFYLVLRLFNRETDKRWVVLGIILGIGLLNKIGFLWLGLGIFHSYMIMTRGKVFLKKGIWIVAGISGLLFLPFIVWNLTHDMAHLEFIRNAQAFKYAGITRLDFVKNLFFITNPVSALVWLPGLYWLFFGKERKNSRILGWIIVTVFLILLINGKSKAEYAAAAMIPLFAAGGIFYEQLIRPVMKRILAWGIGTAVFVSGIVLAPLALPVLPVGTFVKYSGTLGFSQPSSEGKELASLPQFFADMHGWEKMAQSISRVYQMIPEEERPYTVFWGSNYGRAGAIEYFSDRYPLPRAISPHNNFWLWGLGERKDIRHVIFLGGEKSDYEYAFESVTPKGTHRAGYAMPYENAQKIFIGSGPKIDPSETWEKAKHYQ